MKQILFVCSGNSCRSPMAEAYFNMLAETRNSPWRAVSGGTCALNGMPASPKAVRLMKEFNASLNDFRSSSISVGMLQDSDLVVCMERSHCSALEEFYPPAADKIRLLSCWLPCDNKDADLPWLSENYDFYRSCFDTMKPALDNLFEYVNQSK